MKVSLLSLALPLSAAVATPCMYPSSDACGDDQYCAIEDGKCLLRIASQPGTCAPKGTMACPMIFAQVCGCDMNTYDNACSAAAAGVNVMKDGPCDDNTATDISSEDNTDASHSSGETQCTFPDGEECGDDQYCAIEDGKCALRIASQPGTCAKKGMMACPAVLNYVCGCDMNTYDNSCLAGAAGVNVIAEGPCDAPTPVSSSSGDAPVGGDYCTWSPDETCYKDGWPQCCGDNDQPCPPDRQPRCDNNNMPGWDYCVHSSDYECYESGRPKCCERFDGTNCPTDKPGCDVPGMAKVE